MDVQVAEAGSCRRTLTIRIPADDVRHRLDHMFADAAKQVRLKGFRSGRVPRKVLERKFGEAIRADAKSKIVSGAVGQAIRERDLKVVGQPRVEGLDDEPIDETQDLDFSVELDVRPEFEVGDLEQFTVTPQPTDVTEEDVQQALQSLAEQKRTLEEVSDPIEENDFLEAAVVWQREDGTEVLRKEGQKLSPSIPLAGTDPDAFKNSLLGKTSGDTVEVGLTFPDGFEVEEVRGQPGKATLTIGTVQRIQAAPIDDDLAKGFEIDSLDELKRIIGERIGEEKVRAEHARQEEEILGKLVETHPFDLPESLVEDQTEGNLREFRQRLQRENVPEEEIEQKLEESRDEARQHAERTVRLFFLMDAIARQEGVLVGEGDLDAELQRIAAANNVDVATVRDHLEQENRMADLRLSLMERKVRELLRDKARISDKPED